MTTNYLIIGSGIAGLSLALRLAKQFPNKQVTIVTKSDFNQTNTWFAQGGAAAVMNSELDSFERHITDTLLAGDGLCKEAVVQMVVKDAPERLQEIIDWGADFDRNEDGRLSLHLEGGHTRARILHHKDTTGKEIEQTLIRQIQKYPNIRILKGHFAIDLILGKGKACVGAQVFDERDRRVFPLTAEFTTLATGGLGRIFLHTSNPQAATGDGIAMAYRAGAVIRNMEFIQFHPTLFVNTKGELLFLITEALRGAGAALRNYKGERFMFQYDTRGEMASRDIVARSIELERRKNGDPCVYLDCTRLPISVLKEGFPYIFKACQEQGLDLTQDYIPVLPAAHYLCGGIVVDESGQTTLPRLFACGECADTGLHGANRLASNSLVEALVFSERIFQRIFLLDNQQENGLDEDMAEFPLNISTRQEIFPITNSPVSEEAKEEFDRFKKSLQRLMENYVGVIKTNESLSMAESGIFKLHEELLLLNAEKGESPIVWELKNMVLNARLVIEASLKRKENRGGFYNEDCVIANLEGKVNS